MLVPAPHWARLMMLGGCPGPSVAVGGVHWVSTGDCGGVISTADRFCAIEVSVFAGMYPSSRPASRPVSGGATVTGAPSGRITAICTEVVLPTKTGSVPRVASPRYSSEFDSMLLVRYQGPQDPSGRLARIRAEVSLRSLPVNATIEKGVDWLISRTVSPPPRPASGCWTRTVSSAFGVGWRSLPPVIAKGAKSMVAATAVKRIVGGGRRNNTPPMLRMG